MKGNKRANTKPELLVRQRLRAAGLTGYRLEWKVPGKPDIAFPGRKIAIFVNGCFFGTAAPSATPASPSAMLSFGRQSSVATSSATVPPWQRSPKWAGRP